MEDQRCLWPASEMHHDQDPEESRQVASSEEAPGVLSLGSRLFERSTRSGG
jgi:hypothetical protein